MEICQATTRESSRHVTTRYPLPSLVRVTAPESATPYLELEDRNRSIKRKTSFSTMVTLPRWALDISAFRRWVAQERNTGMPATTTVPITGTPSGTTTFLEATPIRSTFGPTPATAVHIVGMRRLTALSKSH